MGSSGTSTAVDQDGSDDVRQPLYLTVYGALRDELHNGHWSIGSSLPSEAALSERFQVSRITTRHALRLLEAEGYIQKAQARRPVVIATSPARRDGWFIESMADIVAMVGDAHLHIQSWRKENSATDAKGFGLPISAPLHCLRGILSRDGKPYARSIIYFPPAIGSRLSRRVFDDAVVFRVVQRELGIRIDDVRLTVWAELAAEDDARDLHCRTGAALLVSQLQYWDAGGTPIEIAYSRALASEGRLSTRLVASPRSP
jgi:GntR family transcriptional regulator